MNTMTRTVANGVSVTDDLHFATFLDASGRLTFVGCVPAGIGDKIIFRFRDPDGKIEQIYEAYIQGAQVPAIDLGVSLRKLRREMSAIGRPERTKGEPTNGNHQPR